MPGKRSKGSSKTATKKAKWTLSVPESLKTMSALISKAWREENGQVDRSEVQVLSDPFTCCLIHDFLPKEVLNELEETLNDLELREKDNDLYKFRQSGDLKSEENGLIREVSRYLRDDVRPWLQEATGVQLDDEEVRYYSVHFRNKPCKIVHFEWQISR